MRKFRYAGYGYSIGACVIAALLWASAAHATVAISNNCAGDGATHVTDGSFGPGEWSASEKQFFPVVGSTGGAYLYAAQSQCRLYLMYDYVNSQSALGGGANPLNSFFDVFFQVPSDQHDYLVRIQSGTFAAFEKPIGTVSSLTADGNFNLADPLWTPLTSEDLALAQFHAAIGFGTSPDSNSAHLMAEFDLSVNLPNSPGIYSPDPAFWSAGASGSGLPDPPISSGIFTLNPDGTIDIVPVLGPNGGPVQQPIPEPGTLALLGAAALAIAATRRRRSTSA